MAIQFSILILLHAALVLITTAEDYKCLPLVLRKTCCWINETYLARNVVIFASILINFLGAILNIVSIAGPRTRQCRGALWGEERRRSRVWGAVASCFASLGTSSLQVPAPSLGTEHKGAAAARSGHVTGQIQWEEVRSAKACSRLPAVPALSLAPRWQWLVPVRSVPPAMCHALKEEPRAVRFFVLNPH